MKSKTSSQNAIVLKLYIVGNSARSKHARENFEKIREKLPDGDFEVIDILETPQVAEENRIMATPMLIKHSPSPSCRIIGDLSDWKKVLEVLDIGDQGRGY